MKKLVKGILDFRSRLLPSYKETFAKLALGQKPDVLYIGCSDSRVAVNVFASTDPGDLFVNRNVGNMVPPYTPNTTPGVSDAVSDGVSAAIEFALLSLNVRYIIVCGHSECGAMFSLVNTQSEKNLPPTKLNSWLSHGRSVLSWLKSKPDFAKDLLPHNRLSQFNVIQQIEHLKTYPIVQERLNSGQLSIHGWWFDIAQASVYTLNDSSYCFTLIDEVEGAKILKRI